MILTCILLIVIGALAAASWIAAKQPNAKATIDKLVPIQGILGIIAGIWGIWALISVLRSTAYLSAGLPVLWTLWLAAALLSIVLGFLLGYALISKYTMKTPEAQAKGEAMRLKLVKYQTPLGLASIAVGLILLILDLAKIAI